MNSPFFVALHNQSETRVIPLVDDEGEVVMFRSAAEAAKAAVRNPLGQAFGFDVFKMFEGEYHDQ